jgi:hypothetical protein
MDADLSAAKAFMASHARMLDRRRLRLLLEGDGRDAVLAALEAYRNPDGGYGWGLEPDLRSTSSQPGAAMHAFEVFEEIAPATSPRAVELCDWLASVSLPDGGVPFALPVTDAAGVAPFWANADPAASSLQITAFVTAAAHRAAAHDPAVAGHPWLSRATRYCLAAIEALDDDPHALELTAALLFLDAAHDTRPEAAALFEPLGRLIPASGLLPVQGGTDEEMIRPLDMAPLPGRPVRSLFTPEAISAELRRLADQQQDDGGWPVDFRSYSPAAELEWRGYETVRAVSILRRNSRDD